MPISKTKMKNAAIAAKSAALAKIARELPDQFVSGPMTGESVNAASMAFKKALIERALGAELGYHLGYTSGSVKPEAVSNHRNGTNDKTVLTQNGPLRIEVPRDRDASFEPLLVPKHERRFNVMRVGSNADVYDDKEADGATRKSANLEAARNGPGWNVE